MSTQTNKDLWQRWGELWNGNLSIADEIIATNFESWRTCKKLIKT